MRAAVRALLENLIDYAGMFPPARLPLSEALHHYSELRDAPEAWMLGRFVCSAGDLLTLQNQAAASGVQSLRVAALGRPGGSVSEVSRQLGLDLQAISAFSAGPSTHAIDVLEFPLASSFPANALDALVESVQSRIAAHGVRIFMEVPLGLSWQSTVEALVASVGTRFRNSQDQVPLVGLKIRCGGAAVPSIEQLAYFIGSCRDRRVPWKATAGLHHPLRHRDPEMGTMAHGFLNVFLAGAFAWAHGLNVTDITELLREESIGAFRIHDTEIGWRDWRCTAEQIRDARRWLPSFGSCSFEEPRDDLRTLGLLA
jgi:hypothetical protein